MRKIVAHKKHSEKLKKNHQENLKRVRDDLEWNHGEICPHARFVRGVVDDEVKYYKILSCNRPDCRVCGVKGSVLHKRNYMRGVKKVLCCKGIGSFVFTVPEEYRYLFRKQVNLDKWSRYVKDFMEIFYFGSRGGSLFHFGSEKNPGVFAPHLNAFVDLQGVGYWLSEDILRWVKERYGKWLEKEFNIKLKCLPVVYYDYAKKIGQKLHLWRYVRRPTLLLCKGRGGDDVDERAFAKLSLGLHGFRNMRWWGSWVEEAGLGAVQVESGKERELAGVSLGVDKNGKKIRWVYGGLWNKVATSVLRDCAYLGAGVFKVIGLEYLEDEDIKARSPPG